MNRLWQVRGAFPGLGAALHAFGLPHGNLLAWHLVSGSEKALDPWPLLTTMLNDPTTLPDYLREGIGKTQQQKWQMLKDERRALLMLLARFNLSNEQALRWYQETEREKAGITLTDREILANPYRIYEEDRRQQAAIAFAVIDRGLFPPEALRKEFPLPLPSLVHESIDERRVRAVIIQTLEEAVNDGHTLLPTNWLIQRVRERPMKPECPLDADTLPIVENHLGPLVATVALTDNDKAFQLDRYVKTSRLISETITKRKNGKANEGDFDWIALVNQAIDGDNNPSQPLTKDDLKARQEKAAALEVLYRSRVSVLMGSADTGKSTLLRALCEIGAVRKGNILLLAPTGKARVRLEPASDMAGHGKTVAQFLNELQRYDGKTGRYFINAKAEKSSVHKTVVIDECSMLTEEQLAALLDAVKGVERLILVGDPHQLPPIGAGRPYVDIAKYLAPENVDTLFPKMASCYAELTVTMRQRAEKAQEERIREDVLLANAFSGRVMDAGADEIWHTVAAGQIPFVKLVRWNQPERLQELLLSELVAELGLQSLNDEVGFEKTIGGNPSEYNGQTNVFFNPKYKDLPGCAEKAEQWQILSPVRQNQAGVLALNRTIQHQFRKRFLDFAGRTGFQKKIPSPTGPEGIIYGDKVINIANNGRRQTFNYILQFDFSYARILDWFLITYRNVYRRVF